MEAGRTLHDGPAGETAQVTVAVPAKPAAGTKFIAKFAEPPGGTVDDVGPEGVTVNGVVGGVP